MDEDMNNWIFHFPQASLILMREFIGKLKENGVSFYSIGKGAGYKRKSRSIIISDFYNGRTKTLSSRVIKALDEISENKVMPIIMNDEVTVTRKFTRELIPKDYAIKELFGDANDNKSQN